ncbi:cyclin-D3-1 [Carica papaya]|uniref:cyclin-D3-1 n=1 Tax=Carica papaya TaxID=3649 RepID=UPI000B8CBAFD|nr:cyclin-D3-1 [Carica papaya]
MAIQSSTPPSLLDHLYCLEERWEEVEEAAEEAFQSFPGSQLFLLEQDLFWEDEELLSLFSKEEEQQSRFSFINVEKNDFLDVVRREAVDWIMKVISHYGFTTLTAILAINYLDRFLRTLHFQREKPWMIQLVAVTCLSLAAKVEETQVPLLLDLQVEETRYIFEAKTIQRMELLVLSSLQWKMHPVTPLSFLDHIMRRLGLKTNLHWEFLRRSERLLLSLVFHSRFVSYLPSVLATATMMHVIDQVEPFNSIDYKNQLLGVLKINQEKVNECYNLILELSRTHVNGGYKRKRTREEDAETEPSSPSGVIDLAFNSDSSNDSWAVECSETEPRFKKNRAQEMVAKRAFVDIVSP